MIEFLLNAIPLSETTVDPNLTILAYLRTKKDLRGTKEGCASGDCGACTVLLGQPDGKGNFIYRAINSCITLLGAAHGGHIVTIEGLAQNDQLHPAQQAMVDKHGSQCGFCTPGFVMSLAALYENSKHDYENNKNAQPDNAAIYTAVSGNLCRCTGYLPIIEAARALRDYPAVVSAIDSAIDSTMGKVEQWHPGAADASLQTPAAQWFRPCSEAQLQTLLRAHPDATLVAGGTDLVLEITQRYRRFAKLIDLSAVSELTTLTVADDEIRIGAAVTYSSAELWLADYYPPMSALFARIGSPQIRNRGTLGGNVANASPIGDIPPLLLAVDAFIEIGSAAGSRRVPAQEFFLDYRKTALLPGEYVRALLLPKPTSADQLYVYKLSKRFEDDISSVLAAIYWRIENDNVQSVRLAFGGMAATPKRAANAEAVLQSAALNETTIRRAMAALKLDFSPLSDVRASAGYRLEMAGNLLFKAYLQQSGTTLPEVMTHA